MNTDRRSFIRKPAGAAGALTLLKLLEDSFNAYSMADSRASVPGR